MRQYQCFGNSTESEGLLYLDFCYILKIRSPSQRLPFLFRTAQSQVKLSRAQTMSPLPPVQVLELPEPRTATRGLLHLGNCESGLFRSLCMVAMLPTKWMVVGKQLGFWVFFHGVVAFIFKFSSNRTNFGVSTPFLMCGGSGMSVRETCPRWCRVRHPCRLRYPSF